MANLARVLYNNVLRDATTVTYSGTETSGFEKENAKDFLDWTLFRTSSGNTDLDYTVGANTDIDSFSIYTKTHTTANTIALKYESSPSTFTTLQTYTATSGKLTMDSFSSVTVSSGRKIRVSFTGGSVDVRQLWVGEYMEMQRGQWADATSPVLNQGIKVTNSISVNGSFLGRSIKRTERSGKIMLEHLTQDWVRNTWEPFTAHASKRPFVYKWSPTSYPNEIGFCFAEKIVAPKNAANSFMAVEMPIRMLVADEEAV
jgi:hypothetical protein